MVLPPDKLRSWVDCVTVETLVAISDWCRPCCPESGSYDVVEEKGALKVGLAMSESV